MRKRKYTHRGLPGFAAGGSAGGEILDFQRQYNPFLGDYPTYGMVGSGQPGAWMFFDDAWLRSQPQQSAPPMGPEPVSNVVEAPDFNIGPDGGGADRYQDDWRGYGYGPSITPADYSRAIDPGQWSSATAVEHMAGLQDKDWQDVEAAVASANQPQVEQPTAQNTQNIGGRHWSGNRAPKDYSFDPMVGYGFQTADITPASNTGYSPAGAYVDPGPVQFSAPLDYSQDYLSTQDLEALNAAPPGVSVEVNPGAVGQTIGQNMTGDQMYALSEQVQGMLGGQIAKDGLSGIAGMGQSPLGQAGAAALSGLMSNAPAVSAPFGEPQTRGFENRSAMSGMSALAGKGSGGSMGLGGLAAPSNPGMGAASALAAAMGLTQDMGLGLVPNQPMEPTNTVAGPVGAPVGAPAMDPFAGLTDTQIEALAAGYHDQAPAVGAPSPIAGFETGLAAAQAAAEHKGRGTEVVGAGSSGGYGAGRGMPGVEYTGSSGLVGDKQGAAGETGQGTGDNSGGGQTGNDSFGGTDSSGNNSDGGSGTDGDTDGDDGSGGSGASGTSGGSGDEGGVGAWARGGRVKSRGLPSMADQVRRAGRGNDTVLAHITPNEAARFDAMQGGPSFNPETGLREYGFLDDIGDFFGDAAKAVAPIAGGLLGGAFGGPLGAAAGAALGTALTGGSLQQSLLSGAIGGIGAYAGPKISGAAQGMFGGGEETVGSYGGDMLNSGGGTDDLGGGSFFSNFAGNPLAMVGLGAAGGLGAGYLMGGGAGDDDAQSSYQRPTPWVPRPGGLGQRNYQPYQGDYTTYGQVGGGAGHSFYDRVNPPVEYYAEGGRVEPKAPSKERMREVLGRELMDGDDYTNPMAVLQTAQMAMPPKPVQQPGLPAPQMQEPQQLQAPVPPTGQGMMGQWQQGAMPPWLIDRDDQGDQRIANLIWRAPGGAVQGPGTGQSDDIPAMLSDGEYVVSADVVSHLGGGSNNAGADRLDQLMANVRNHRSQGGKGLPPTAKSPMEYMGR